MELEGATHLAVDAFDAVGVLVLVLGFIASFVIAASRRAARSAVPSSPIVRTWGG
jgi:hypothetical protein